MTTPPGGATASGATASGAPASGPGPRPGRAALAILSAVCAAGFAALGIWQVERRAGKLDLIARVDARIGALPVAAPSGAVGPDDEYRRVRVAGTFRHDRETLVQALTVKGAGFWVLTPLVAPDGTAVLVNRGFVPPDRRASASRRDGSPAGPTAVTGLLRLSEPGGGFLRANDPSADRWYSRDVAAIAGARGLGAVAPYFIDADGTPNGGGWPLGGLTVVNFPNNHLVYALTWFALSGLAGSGTVLALQTGRRVPIRTLAGRNGAP